MKRHLRWTVLAAVAFGLTACGNKVIPQLGVTLPVNIVAMLEKQIHGWGESIAPLHRFEFIKLRPRVSGYFQELKFDAGPMINPILATTRGSSAALKVFFGMVEVLLLVAGVSVYRQRHNLFGFREKENDSYASSNLRMTMLVLVWIHAVILITIMLFEV